MLLVADGGGPTLLLLPIAVVAVVYLAVLWVMATPAYVLEDIGVIAAPARSRDLIRGVTGLLYIDERIRKERFDVELARMAAEPK